MTRRSTNAWCRAVFASALSSCAFYSLGCSGTDRNASAVAADDSAGITIVENGPQNSQPVCTVSAELRIEIGQAEGAPEYQLYRVFDAATLSDGRIALVNQGSGQIRLYDRAGKHLHSFGREGGGPGEFRRVFQLWITPGDTLVVGDYRPWRFSYFTSEGKFIRLVEPQPMHLNPPRAAAVLDNGSFLLAGRCCNKSQPGFHEEFLHVVRHAPTGETVDTVGVYSNGRWGALGKPEDNFVGYPLFEAAARMDADGNRIVLGRGRKRELEVLDATGRLTHLIRWTGDDLRVTAVEIDAYRKKTMSDAQTPSARRLAELLASESRPTNDQFPALSDVRLGRSGHIWIKEFPRPSRAGADPWHVFDPAGMYQCKAQLPTGFEVYEIGADYILGKVNDELGVEHVRIYDVQSPGQSK